ncbi:amino acid transporter, transmembrane domain-containing protein, partial [Tanacetum coccineum]
RSSSNYVDTRDRALNFEAKLLKELRIDACRLKRTGTYWTASSHIITAVIGSGVLSLAWAVGQLGWIAGPTMMILFALVILYTSNLLAQCYRSGDPVTGPRSYTYMEAVKAHLGGKKVKICGMIQYINLFGVAIGYTIAASVSMMAIKRSNCFHKSHGKDPCHMSSNGYMITFGIIEILFSQIPDFDQVWWLSIVAAIMSFTYSFIGLALGIAETAVLAMLLPFFNDVVGLLGALGFWAISRLYFPIVRYSLQKIKRWSSQWIGFQILSLGCLLVSVAAAVGSIAGVVLDLKTYKPFKTSY